MRNYRVGSEATPSVKRMTYRVEAFGGIDAKSEENTLSLNAAREVANVGVKNGTLNLGPGFSLPELYEGRTLPQPEAQGLHFSKLYVYPLKDAETGERRDRLLARNEEDGLMYRIELENGEEWSVAGGLSLSEDVAGMPVYHYGRDSYLLCRPSEKFYLYDEDWYTLYPSPHFTSICCQRGRAFAVCPDEGRLYFSRLNNFLGWTPDPGDPNAAGYFEIEEDGGRAQEVAAFNGMVFLFKENAVMQLKVYSEVTEFQLSKVFETTGHIYAKTVAVGETAIYFLTDDGLYAFDGYGARRIFEGFTVKLGDKRKAHAVYAGWKYYLACNVEGGGVYGDEGEALENNALAVFDLSVGSVSVCRGADVLSMASVAKGRSQAVLCTFRNKSRKGALAKIDESGAIFGLPFEKYWAGAETDLSEPARYKILRRAYISSPHAAEVEFVLDGKGYRYALNGSPNAQQININRPCRTLKTVFRSKESQFKIRDMTLEVDLARRYYGAGE